MNIDTKTTVSYCKCGKPIFSPTVPEGYDGPVCDCKTRELGTFKFVSIDEEGLDENQE